MNTDKHGFLKSICVHPCSSVVKLGLFSLEIKSRPALYSTPALKTSHPDFFKALFPQVRPGGLSRFSKNGNPKGGNFNVESFKI
jgi:hypothetical protein